MLKIICYITYIAYIGKYYRSLMLSKKSYSVSMLFEIVYQNMYGLQAYY